MPDNDPLADIFTLFAAPIAGTIRSVEQFRTGVDEFLRGVENFNRTMANLNETTERINSLLADVEEPIRAAVPQFTRSVKAADELMKVVSGPAMAAAPALNQIAEAIATPGFQQLPARIAQFNEMIAVMSHRLGPLTQLAETAGGLFGAFRFPGTSPSSVAKTAATLRDELEDDFDDDFDDDVEPDDDEQAPAPAATRTADRPAAKRTTGATKRAAPKRTATKRAATKRTATKRAAPKRAATKKRSATGRRSPAEQAAPPPDT